MCVCVCVCMLWHIYYQHSLSLSLSLSPLCGRVDVFFFSFASVISAISTYVLFFVLVHILVLSSSILAALYIFDSLLFVILDKVQYLCWFSKTHLLSISQTLFSFILSLYRLITCAKVNIEKFDRSKGVSGGYIFSKDNPHLFKDVCVLHAHVFVFVPLKLVS